MSKYFSSYSVLILLLAVLLLPSCGEKFRMDYVPTPEEIRNKLSEFIIDGVETEGLYANMDVDSMIFRYTPKVSAKISTENILSNIIEKAEKEDWKVSERQATAIRFNRFRPAGRFFSSEDVRVKIIQKNLRVYVAWVQADSSKPVSRFKDTGEAKYAKKVVWPMLESYIAQEERGNK